MSRSISFIALALLCCAFALRSDAAEPAAGIPFDAEHTYALELPKGALTPRALTVAAWVKSENPAESQGVLDIGLPADSFSFYIYKNAFRMLVEGEKYAADVKIFANDRTGLLVDVSRMLTESGIPIRSMNTWTSRQGLVTMETSFEVGSVVELRSIVDRLRTIEGVVDVERATA